MRVLFVALALVVMGGCASNKPPPLPMPSPQAPRIAINKPLPKSASVAPPPAVPRPPNWAVKASDGTVAAMLARWAKDAGWSVHWVDAPEIRITGDGQVDKPDFLAAADLVISDARAKGYRIKAKAFADNVLEIRKVDE
jgi:hypothetical protein